MVIWVLWHINLLLVIQCQIYFYTKNSSISNNWVKHSFLNATSLQMLARLSADTWHTHTHMYPNSSLGHIHIIYHIKICLSYPYIYLYKCWQGCLLTRDTHIHTYIHTYIHTSKLKFGSYIKGILQRCSDIFIYIYIYIYIYFFA